MRYRYPNPYRGLLFGAIAGAAASWTMNRFQSLLSKMDSPRRSGFHRDDESSEDATMKAAGRIARAAHLRPLTREQRAKAGPIVHYAFGTVAGAAYGLATEYFPEAHTGFGIVFGALLFVLSDEVAVPLAGLSGKPSEYPASVHAKALASHLVFGASTEAVRATLTRAA